MTLHNHRPIIFCMIAISYLLTEINRIQYCKVNTTVNTTVNVVSRARRSNTSIATCSLEEQSSPLQQYMNTIMIYNLTISMHKGKCMPMQACKLSHASCLKSLTVDIIIIIQIFFAVCLSVRDGCGRGRNEFAGCR